MRYKIKYDIPKKYTIGGFGVMFNSVIYFLCDIDNKNNGMFFNHYIDWSNENILYYDKYIGNNVWDYYFDNNNNIYDIVYEHKIENTKKYQFNINIDIIDKQKDKNKIEHLHNIYVKYIKINDNIINEVNKFLLNMRGKVLGVQYRYTDKISEVYQIKPDKLINILISELNNYDYIYIATDYQPLIDKLSKISNKFRYLVSLRSSNNVGSHFLKNERQFDAYLKGYDVMMDMLILSKCDDFYYSRSNISLSTIIMNNLKYKKIICINEN